MSRVKVNDAFVVEGKFSVEVFADKTQLPVKIYKRGIFESEAPYITDITSLENERYYIEGIDVYKEAYGSEDDTISYEFNFESMNIKNK